MTGKNTFYSDANCLLSGNASGNKEDETNTDVIAKLCRFIFTKDTTDRIRAQAILFLVYHLALHDEWFLARDLLLMSHLQKNIEHSDVSTMVRPLNYAFVYIIFK